MHSKFTGLALAGLLVSANASAAPAFMKKNKKVSSKNQKKQLNKRGLRALSRKLEDAEFEITSDYTVSFNQCLHLTVESEDLFDENNIAYAKAGTLSAVKSVVLFDVQQTSNAYYEGSGSTYMVDLASWVGSTVEAPLERKEAYCEACRESEEVCYPEEDEEEADEAEEDEEEENDEENDEEENDEDEESNDEDENDEENDEDEESGDDEDEDNDEDGESGDEDDEDRKKKRKLANNNANYVKCNTCEAQGCFDEDGDDDALGEEDVQEWIQELAECVQLEDVDGNGNNYYAGLTCNGKGTGVTIGVFMDEDCLLLTNKAYSNVMDDDSYALYSMSADLMTYSFLNDISCEKVQYAALQNDDDEEEEEEDDDAEDEVDEVCENIMGSDFVAKLNDCGDADDDGDGDNDAAENNYDWYTYDLSEEDSEEVYAVCTYVTAFEGDYETTHSNVDYESGSGEAALYDFSKSKNASDSGAGKVIGIIFLVIAAIGVTAFAVSSCTKKSSSDSKTEPLNKNGQMA